MSLQKRGYSSYLYEYSIERLIGRDTPAVLFSLKNTVLGSSVHNGHLIIYSVWILPSDEFSMILAWIEAYTSVRKSKNLNTVNACEVAD